MPHIFQSKRAVSFCWQDIAAGMLACLAFLLVSHSRVRYTGSDPRSSLLLTESILTHGTVKLDHYGEKVLAGYGYTIVRIGGHYYYYFPIGSSIVSLPFVAAARLMGLNMVKSEGKVQILIAAFIAALTLLLLYRLAKLFIPPLPALAISAVFWFGSSFSSTDGTALWSHDFTALFALSAIWFAAKGAKDGSMRLQWPFVGSCLFLAYLCRPTLSLLAPFLLVFLFTYDEGAAFRAGGLLSALLGCFVIFSLIEFHKALPDYYRPARLAGGYFWTALYGNLLSPARGLLIYSPFIVLAWLCYRSSIRSLRLKHSWLLIAIAWPLAHLIVVSRFPHWWAGWSYGPRLMTDILPGLFLFTVCTWPITLRNRSDAFLIVLLGIASGFAIYANTYQGLFNQYTALWDAEPDIDQHPEYLFDWSYPQFLNNESRQKARVSSFEMKMSTSSVHEESLPGKPRR